jgi:FKBP-type peptidyl-prolyl cis-trans isomerase SlyD
MKIASGAAVTFHYTLTDQSGELIDSSDGDEPLAYLHGHDEILPALERQLAGLEPGAELRITVPVAEAYGERRPDLRFEVPRTDFDPDADLTLGAQVMPASGDEPEILTIAALTESTVTLDANHPLAGKDLAFAIKIVQVREATAEELAHGHSHEGGHHH